MQWANDTDTVEVLYTFFICCTICTPESDGGKKLKFDEMYQLFERKQPFSIKSTVFESSKKFFYDFAEVLGDFFRVRNLALL